MMGFITITLLMYSPLLQGKKLLQSDSVQYKGMSRQIQEEREKNNEELYWIDNAFGGMPTYQLGAKYPYDILTPIHKVVRLLTAPAFFVVSVFRRKLFVFTGIRFSFALCSSWGIGLWIFNLFTHHHPGRAQHQSTSLGVYAHGSGGGSFAIYQKPQMGIFSPP